MASTLADDLGLDPVEGLLVFSARLPYWCIGGKQVPLGRSPVFLGDVPIVWARAAAELPRAQFRFPLGEEDIVKSTAIDDLFAPFERAEKDAREGEADIAGYSRAEEGADARARIADRARVDSGIW